jgi:hypothetical protein
MSFTPPRAAGGLLLVLLSSACRQAPAAVTLSHGSRGDPCG